MKKKTETGVVVIGRNEGQRLHRCLQSVLNHGANVVYVDSGSSDNSVELAEKLGADVIHLDLNTSFTAARARNDGFNFLLETYKEIEFIQFVDGDCEVHKDWFSSAINALETNELLAAVCGRLRERYPERTIYNKLCDIEWDTPVGEAEACGGIAMMRTSALQAVHGFNGALIAGEEPELCLRMRQQGWKILRINAEMALHDVAMTSFVQWWKRNQRAGYAYTEVSLMHARKEEKFWIRETKSIMLFGFLIPFIILALMFFWGGWMILGFAIYPLQMIKVALFKKSTLESVSDSLLYGVFVILSKFPQFVGQLNYFINRWRGKHGSIIEYK